VSSGGLILRTVHCRFLGGENERVIVRTYGFQQGFTRSSGPSARNTISVAPVETGSPPNGRPFSGNRGKISPVLPRSSCPARHEDGKRPGARPSRLGASVTVGDIVRLAFMAKRIVV